MNPLKTGNFTCMRKQCVPGLSSGQGGGRAGNIDYRPTEKGLDPETPQIYPGIDVTIRVAVVR